MERQELLIRIDELEKQILELPAGSIAKKKVRGKDYYYHRWFEGKKRAPASGKTSPRSSGT